MLKDMTKKQKKAFYQILAAIFVFLITFFVPDGWVKLAFCIVAYVIAGGNVLIKAAKNIARGQIFDENFLMGLASIGAFLIGEYTESVAVMLFYQVGELFQSLAVSKSRKSISNLMDIRPDYANIEKDGKLIEVDPDEVQIGDVIVIKPGERVPLDGVVIEGNSMLDTAALTGESVPRKIQEGDEIISGVINQRGLLRVRVTKEFGESTVTRILELVENASSKKSKSENFITKFARYYTPAVVLSAVVLAILPPLLFPQATFTEWLHRALIFLVISCPCALVISIPLGFFGGIGGASKAGILVKGSNYLEALSQTEIVVFDKTGTLTKGTFDVQQIEAVGGKKEELLKMAAYAESYSDHPISQSLKRAYGREIDRSFVDNVEEISGHGVKAVVNGIEVHAGNQKLMEKIGISISKNSSIGTIVHIAFNGVYAGFIQIADEIKPDAKQAISELKKCGVKKTVMLTGDNKTIAEAVGKEIGIDEVYAELLPADKVDQVEKLLTAKSLKGKLVFTGDGINDAPVLSRADIGIAMGGLGSDAAIEAADVVIMTDEPSKIAEALAISRKTIRIVKQNIVFALVIKFFFLGLGTFGIATMWEAVFADVGVSVLAILNAMRALRYKGHTESSTKQVNFVDAKLDTSK